MASILGTDFSASLDPYTSRLFQIESGGDPNAVTGSNRGLGQFGPAESKKYGITDSSDPAQQARAVAQERQEFTGILQKRLGRDPTPGEIYLMHQQGIAGGPALLTAEPSTPAWQVIKQYYPSGEVAKRAITGNIPRGSPLYGVPADQITAGDFSKFWVNKFEGSGIPNIAPQHGIAQNVSSTPISSNFPLGPQAAPQLPALGAPQQPQQQQALAGGFGSWSAAAPGQTSQIPQFAQLQLPPQGTITQAQRPQINMEQLQTLLQRLPTPLGLPSQFKSLY